MIWLTLLIPVISVIVLKVFYRREVVLWELLVPLLFGTILTVSAYYITNSILTSSYEKRTHYVTSATYYEDWDEWISKTCTRTVSCGKNCTTTQIYDCSYRKYHPERWVAGFNTGHMEDISRESYNIFKSKWEIRPTYQDMKRDYYTDDGDAYYVLLPNTELKNIFPFYTTHSYENRVHASYSVFGYVDVTDEDVKNWGLFNVPDLNGSTFNLPQIYGWDNPSNGYLNEHLTKKNSLIGASKQVMMWVLVHKNADPYTGQMQESLWKGGHKNEFTISIGVDSVSNKIQWVHPFSWTDSEITKIRIRDYVASKDTLSDEVFVDILNFSVDEIKASYERKNFSDFNYLHVEIPIKYVVIVIILQLILNIGLGWYVVNNEHQPYETKRW